MREVNLKTISMFDTDGSRARSWSNLSRLTDLLGSDIYDDYMFTFNTQNIFQINSIFTLILKPTGPITRSRIKTFVSTWF